MRIGYSYSRYSSPGQGDGDSVRRQADVAGSWSAARCPARYKPDLLGSGTECLTRGGIVKRAGAAAFLSEVETGHIPRGSVLIIENLDRLSRENPWDAVPLLCSLVNAGISVATLSPSEMTFERGCDLTGLVLAVVEFGRSHSESKSKANRMSEVWSQKRKAVREHGAIMTKKLPAWVEFQGGKLALIPERARVVRRIFNLTLQGYGLSLVVRELARDKVPVWGRSKTGWSKAYLHKIISGRVVLESTNRSAMASRTANRSRTITLP